MAQTLEHNKEVTTVVPVTIPAFDDDLNIIQKLDDEPNDVGGLTAAELKAKFDEGNLSAQQYINNVLIPTVIADDLSEQARQAAEAERVANEIERVTNEQNREKAEEERVNETSGVVARATAQAEAAAESARKATQAALGQIVDGSLEPAKFSGESRSMMVRENLLDNWYFGNTVDQRGGYVVMPQANYYTSDWTMAGTTDKYYPVKKRLSSHAEVDIGGTTYLVGLGATVRGYTGTGYTIDRWKSLFTTGTVTVNNGYITMQSVVDNQLFLKQPIESNLQGKQLTFSVLTLEGELISGTAVMDGTEKYPAYNSSVVLVFNSDNSVCIVTRPNTTENIIAAKLELGSEQTLAHQENGEWVLNEIPDYGEQLRRCQRYFVCYKAGTVLPCVAYSEQDGWYLDAVLPITGMRTYPVNNMGEGLACSVRNINAESDFISKTISNWGQHSDVQLLRIAGGEKTSATWPYIIRMDADLTFSADL